MADPNPNPDPNPATETVNENGDAIKMETETKTETTEAASAVVEPKAEEADAQTEKKEETTATTADTTMTAIKSEEETETPSANADANGDTSANADAMAIEAAAASPLGRRPRRSRTAAVEAMEAMKAKTNAKPDAKEKKQKKNNTASDKPSEAAVAAHQQRQDALDQLNIGRLVEQNKHIPHTGQYYPHHGRILEKLKVEGRIPERWVVQWEPAGNNTDTDDNAESILRRDEWTRTDLEEHDALVEAWQNPFRLYNGRRPEKTRLGQPLKNALETIKDRYHKLVLRDIEHESFGDCRGKASQTEISDENDTAGDLLPTLVLMAALEDALQSSLQYQRQKEVERQQTEGTETAVKKTSKNVVHAHPPLYYTTNPSHYLVAPSRQADAEEDLQLLAASRNPKATVTPAVLAQRVRDGCQWAYSYLQQQQNDDTPSTAKFLDAPGHASLSATAIELETKKAEEAKLMPPPIATPDAAEDQGANGEAAAATVVEQRRSVRSGLGERASLFDPTAETGRRSTRGSRGAAASYNDNSYIPEPNVVQKGGRVALWWLQMLEEEAKKQQQQEQENNDDDEETEKDKEPEETTVEMANAQDETTTATTQEEKPTTSKSSAPDRTEAAAASNMITGDSYEAALGGGDDEDEDEATRDTDEDFDMSKDGDEEHDSDDQLENVETERRSLTPVPDLAESEEEEEDSEEEEEEDEEIDEEHAIVWDNPYLTPSVPAILEYLSKPKSISGEDVQKAMDDIILRLRHNRRTTSYGLPVQSLQACDRALLHWESPDHPAEGSLVLKCVSGETVNELQRLDAQNFGRCKFELDILGAQEATIQIQNRQDFEQRAEDYKVRLKVDKWRFKGIHEGHAVWPHWREHAQNWIQHHVVATAAAAAAPKEESPAAAAATATATATTTTPANDEALAKSLAAAQAEEAAAAASSGRRTARRSRSSRGGASGADSGGGVFYGNQSSMTQKQLMDALLRLVKTQNSGTLASLQELVSDDSSDPLRRIRIALGKLLWKRNLVAKLPVSCAGSDQKLVQHLEAGKSLLSLQPHRPPTNDGEPQQQQLPSEPEASGETSDLLAYLSNLHATELRLRKLVLQQLGRIPLPVIATAADERLGTLENMDASDFEDPSTMEWKTSGSDWISQLIYRPNTSSTLGDEHTPCYWYKIASWSESIASEADDAEEDAVERRKRFRAVPHLHTASEDLLLTEAQVSAGKQAGDLQAQDDRTAAQSQLQWTSNPFATEIGDRITLVALDGDDEDNKRFPTEISGRVVGQDSRLDASDDDSTDVEYRILVLPEDNNTNNNQGSLKTEDASPFWAVLDVREDDGSYLCQPLGQSKWYAIENQDFHVDSEPYKACQGVLEWLSRQSKAMPFMEPVDPVALGIPSYPEVVKHPMDISTMMQKLENGAYSNIPPGQSVGNSLVCRMLNGPFRKDVELIFDNAMLFNPPDDWISVAAASLKKSVTKKIDTLAYAAEKKHSGGGGKKSIYADEDSDVDMYEYESDHDEEYTTGSSRRGKRKRSAQTTRAASNKDEAAAKPMEQPIRLQNCLKDGNDLRGRFAGLPLNGFASTYSMPPKWSCKKAASSFADAAEKESPSEDDANNDGNDEDDETPQANQEYVQEMADLLAIHKRLGEAEASSLRRSARETRPTSGRRSNRDRKKDAAKKTEGLEYYLQADHELGGKGTPNPQQQQQQSLSSIPSSRLDVEVLLEKRHEDYYAKLYKTYESDLVSVSVSQGEETANEPQPNFALYSSGSFPPYLGRVVPSNNQHGCTWEIRPSFVVPALRWVIRGLIVSGHLTAVEPMSSWNSTSSGGSGLDYTTSGVILSNDVYYWNPETCKPFEVLDTRGLQRKKRAGKSDDDSSEDEVEMSEYEKLRAERVARNAERLRLLGLA